MTKFDWYKRNPSKFFAGTVGMGWDVKAVYGLVLDLIYDAQGELVDDPSRIVHYLGVGMSKQRWKSIRDELVARGKLVVRNGNLTNPKADRELSDDSGKSDKTRTKVRQTPEIIEPIIGQQIDPVLRADLFENKDIASQTGAKVTPVTARARENQNQNQNKSRPVDVVVQVHKIAEALGQKPAKYWETNYASMIDADDLTFEDVLEAAKTHKANGREIIRSITALRALACAKRDRRMGAAQSQAVDTVDVGNVTVDEWKTALVTLARAGVWNDPVLGDLPGTDDYRGPKDLEALFLEGWRKQGSHPIDELDADHHWQTYPADNPDPIRRTRWSRIK